MNGEWCRYVLCLHNIHWYILTKPIMPGQVVPKGTMIPWCQRMHRSIQGSLMSQNRQKDPRLHDVTEWTKGSKGHITEWEDRSTAPCCHRIDTQMQGFRMSQNGDDWIRLQMIYHFLYESHIQSSHELLWKRCLCVAARREAASSHIYAIEYKYTTLCGYKPLPAHAENTGNVFCQSLMDSANCCDVDGLLQHCGNSSAYVNGLMLHSCTVFN